MGDPLTLPVELSNDAEQLLRRIAEHGEGGVTLRASARPSSWEVANELVAAGLLRVGVQRCGPLAMVTGDFHGDLTEAGRAYIALAVEARAEVTRG